MIAGVDIVFPAVGDSATLEACARIVARRWPNSRFEDAITGDKYQRHGEIPFGTMRELLVYPNGDSEEAWDSGSADAAENSMLYLIARPDEITVVIDNPNTAEMRSILDAIHDLLWSDILNTYKRAA